MAHSERERHVEAATPAALALPRPTRILACRTPHTPALKSQSHERLSAVLADRYRLEREIGQGGMATVYLAVVAGFISLQIWLHQMSWHGVGSGNIELVLRFRAGEALDREHLIFA